jgi:hypothetical protein
MKITSPETAYTPEIVGKIARQGQSGAIRVRSNPGQENLRNLKLLRVYSRIPEDQRICSMKSQKTQGSSKTPFSKAGK